MPVLDASFLIDAQTGEQTALSAFEHLRGQRLLVPYQAALEFVAGFEDAIPAYRTLRENFEVVVPDEDQLLLAAKLFQESTAKGARVSWSDLHIAVLARLEDDILLTADERPMRALGARVWNYRRSPTPPSA